VKKGDLLMKIKPDVYLAQRDQWAAGLAQAKAQLTRATLDYERIKSLYEKGLVSKSEYDQSVASYQSATAAYSQAQASLSQATEALRKTTILSPMDGTVSQLNNELGERVLGTQQFQGTNVMTIADLSRMEGRIDVSETDVILVSVGDTARLEIDAFPDRKVTAVVYEIANTGRSKGTGTQEEVTNFQVKMRVLGKGLTLLPGMSMTADIETETRQNTLTVPIQSVTVRAPKAEMKQTGDESQSGSVIAAGTQRVKNENKPKEIVFVVDNGVIKAVPVKRGISSDQYTEIVSGLSEGSYKAINRELEDGAKVRVEESKMKSAEKPKE
jgi:HlyD family secretion protein